MADEPAAPALALTFRQELVPHLFKALRGGWSCALVGLPGGGLSNTLRFLTEPRIAAHHLGEAGPQWQVMLVEGGGLAEPAALFAALLRQVLAPAHLESWPRADQAALRRLAQAPQAADALRAVIDYACRHRGRRVVFCLDEFDDAYRALPAAALRALRSLRDDYKYQLGYVLGLRREPGELAAMRAPAGEAGLAKFTELFDDHTFPLRPYTRADALTAITRKTAGWDALPTSEQRAELVRASGGHARLLMAALVYCESRLRLPWANVERGLLGDPGVLAACAALWDGLDALERAALWRLAREARDAMPPGGLERLLLRGLAVGGPPFVFSSLFEAYVSGQPEPSPPSAAEARPTLARLRDPDARVNW